MIGRVLLAEYLNSEDENQTLYARPEKELKSSECVFSTLNFNSIFGWITLKWLSFASLIFKNFLKAILACSAYGYRLVMLK